MNTHNDPNSYAERAQGLLQAHADTVVYAPSFMYAGPIVMLGIAEGI